MMEKKTINKSIDIQAPKQKVWEVLFDDRFSRIWYVIFSEGTHAITDWVQGSTVVFKDSTECGLLGKVVVNKPFEKLSLEYEGVLMYSKEDYDSEMAVSIKGGLETYVLDEKNGNTLLSIACDMSPDQFESMSHSWDDALLKVKDLSEQNN
ncbi:MAG: hypothetical protein WKF89_15755 [Chitinophagaceae bacterium]